MRSRIVPRLVRLEVEGERAGDDAVRQCPGPERSADEAADLLRQLLQHFDLEPIEVVSHCQSSSTVSDSRSPTYTLTVTTVDVACKSQQHYSPST